MLFSLFSPQKNVRFPRNRHRENDEQDIFNIAYRSLSFMATIVIPAIFTPAIIISSLVSHGILFSLGNIALALGYSIHFAHRLIVKDLSYLELLTSLLFLGTLLGITLYSAPIAAGFTLIHTINYLNLISTSINSFFLIRNFIIPPFQALIKHTFKLLGYELDASFYSKAPLTLEQDRSVIDRLLNKHYHHDSFSDSFSHETLKPFNHLLEKMVTYINKYHEPLFGTLLAQNNINRLDNAIHDLVINGNTDSGLAFINKKIDFKTTKINLINEAIQQETKREKQESSVTTSQYSFFQQQKKPSVSELTEELQRQKTKVAALELCRPK